MKSQQGKDTAAKQITSPDQLRDYLHVTNAAIWIVLGVVILLLVASLIWAAHATIDSYTDATAIVTDRSMLAYIDDPKLQDKVKSGMTIVVGDTSTKVTSVGHDKNGRPFAVAATTLNNGTYAAKIVYKQEKVLSLLFN